MFEYVGVVFGLVILVLDVWAIVTIFNSHLEAIQKALWIVLILVLPVIGLILWFLLEHR